MPEAFASPVPHSYPYTQNFGNLCTPVAPIPRVRVKHFYTSPELRELCTPVPQKLEPLRVLHDVHTHNWNFCKFCTPRATIPGVRVQHFSYRRGTSVSSAGSWHNPRNFCEICDTSIHVPETPGSSVRLPYPCPESINPTEYNLAFFYCKKISYTSSK